MTSKQIAKGRIDQIKSLPYAGGNLLVLSDPNLYLVDINSGLKADLVIKVLKFFDFEEKIKFFVVNEYSKKHALEIVAVTKNKEAMILQYNIQTNKFEL